MRRIFTLAMAAALSLAYSVSGLDLEKFWKENKDSIWEMDDKALAGKTKLKMTWMSKEKTVLRYVPPSPQKSELKVFGIKAAEANFSFQNGRLSSIYISLYNRGDKGSIERTKFRKMRLTAMNGIPDLTGVTQVSKDRTYIAGKPCNIRYWKTENGVWYVRWSESRGMAEYLTLLINNPELPIESAGKSVRAEATAESTGKNVQTDEEGYRFIDVPMVNQGDKGYCVAATVSRIMQYYGADVDQHMIAQIAKTDAKQGTLVKDIYESLDKAKGRLNVRIDKIWALEYFDSFETTHRFISKYNITAKKMKLKRLDEDAFVTKKGKVKIMNISKMWAEASKQPEVYKQMRLRDTGGMEKFQNSIVEYIDKGIPLVWLVPGHMRIINGYNSKTGEVIYTDSWGAGHERKIMPKDEAWVLTSYLFVIRPQKR